ncbi:MAG: ribosome small subunit-dependent GTPase A [Lachnospiraceae bacterium]|nr:ribosome small subunit-dependent GTPase A [Lachnospiraceae bacterium]HCJ08333.1 ribosome small subunit-dependent GTPase A [Lachnospiraceae bacterium]
MKGKIIKGIAGFYYVYAKGNTYECKAKGKFRNQKVKPLVGDDVEITILDEQQMLGNIECILPRHSELIRPAVANVDQTLVVFAAAMPEPNWNLLDRFLIMMERQQVPTIICFNKMDLVTEETIATYRKIYANSGCQVLEASTYEEHGMDELQRVLEGKTTALAGPSGVGKSSIMNMLNPSANMDTGDISRKIQRGKHTTRHSEILPIGTDTYLMDTPGFSSIYFYDLEPEELKQYYREFEAYEPYCRFGGCNHVGERECGVKQAVADGEIAKSRYENYCLFFEELKDKRKY